MEQLDFGIPRITTLTSVQTLGSIDKWPAGCIYIGMPGNAARAFGITDNLVGPFGKPWHLLKDPRGWAAAYHEYLVTRMAHEASFERAVKSLYGHTLVCWCTAKQAKRGEEVACHGRILLELVEMLNA